MQQGQGKLLCYYSFFPPNITSFREHAHVPCVVATVEEEGCDCKVHSLKCRKGIYWDPRETGDADEIGASQGAQAAEIHLGEMLLLLYEFLLTSLGFCRYLTAWAHPPRDPELAVVIACKLRVF